MNSNPEAIYENAQSATRSVDRDLILAAATGNIVAVVAALEQGADLKATTSSISFGSTPARSTALHFAADRLVSDMCEMLLAKNVDLEARNAAGATPLLSASTTSNGACIPALLRYGSDTSVSDDRGNTALHLAAVSSSDGVSVEVLLEAGLDVNTQNKDGQTALHLAVTGHRAGTVAVLLHHGADLTVRDSMNNQAMHCLYDWRLCARENIDIAKLLLEAGADPNERGERGKDLLQVSQCHPEIVQILAVRDAKRRVDNVVLRAGVLAARDAGTCHE